MPPQPKHPGARARTNRSSTAATLTEREPEDVRIPALPAHPKDGESWHANAQAMWTDLWASPMSAEYDASDIHQMYVLLRLVDMFWRATTAQAMKDLAAEIRLSGQRFGISPLDRRRLEWQIEASEEAKDRGKRRRGREDPPAPPPTGSADPRAVLRSVN